MGSVLTGNLIDALAFASFVGLTEAFEPKVHIGGFTIPALLDNVLGGFTLVTWLNHAQVVSGGGRKKT